MYRCYPWQSIGGFAYVSCADTAELYLFVDCVILNLNHIVINKGG